MERKINHSDSIYKEIKQKQTELNIGYNKLYKEIEQRIINYSKDTYASVFKRKTTSGDTFKNICEILNINDIPPQYNDQISIEWLFSTLSSHNQNAIYILTNMLLIEEKSPDFFEDHVDSFEYD